MIRRLVFALALCLTFSSAAMAQGKIAVANLAYVSGQSEMGKEAEKMMNERFGADRTKLENQAKTIDQKAQELNKQAAALSESARNSRVAELQKLQEALEKDGTAYTKRLGEVQQTMTGQMQEILAEAASNLGKNGGYSVILDSAVIIFADGSTDVTPAYVEEVNKVWAAKGGKFTMPN